MVTSFSVSYCNVICSTLGLNCMGDFSHRFYLHPTILWALLFIVSIPKDYLEVFVPLCVLQEQWWIGHDGCFVFYWLLVAGSLIFFPNIRLAVSVHTHLKLAKWPDWFSQSTVWLFIARQRCGGWVKMIPSDQVKFLLSMSFSLWLPSAFTICYKLL